MSPSDMKEAKHKALLPNGRSRKPPSKFDDVWAKVHIRLVMHPSWKHLTSTAKDILITCIAKASYAASKGMKNGAGKPRFQFTYAEGKRLFKIPAPTFNRAMDELKERGFVGVSDPGGTLHGKGRPAQFFLSDRWKEWKPPLRSTTNIDKARAARKCGSRVVSLAVDLSQAEEQNPT